MVRNLLESQGASSKATLLHEYFRYGLATPEFFLCRQSPSGVPCCSLGNFVRPRIPVCGSTIVRRLFGSYLNDILILRLSLFTRLVPHKLEKTLKKPNRTLKGSNRTLIGSLNG